MTTLVATSVVRGSRQGESHGGVYLIDLTNERVLRTVDWDAVDIDWQGRGWDRGLRGIEFDGDRIFIAASDELFVYDQTFRQITSYRCPYLKHCHEISRYERRLYLTSTGFDAILGFDLDRNLFSWGLSVSRDKKGLRAVPFDPESRHGPPLRNELHINSIFCESRAMYISGLRTSGIHAYTGRHLNQVATLPDGTHNARPYRNGVLFNDTQKNVVRFVPQQGKQGVFNIPVYNPGLLTHTEFDDSRVARQAFGRGLCVIRDGVIAGGSSPSTVTLYDIDQMKTTQSLNLSLDIRNAIHGLETWPFPGLPDD
ncbi:MAG: hypothetical protein VYC07_04295 [Pseudomonadota bacterium]|uniref:SMP-30/Gluconolactonase/LRE-like region domain-containing protein n=1 Tax=marine metagenome TaxID=408172 RepID=A0A381YVD4_9ZZZZ|nr:hypothetical protein [Gammaproteobacteria bacterium]MEC8833901.1 hypothetical protein [Pseudomonadota bacterium]HCP50124.1 hypothetical protein [Gammaproteobacteria bacterium]|tara:strand:- start:9847 stop:10782 length:936 start_codon:yes stop_codon:yes gene_type:complete